MMFICDANEMCMVLYISDLNKHTYNLLSLLQLLAH